MSSLKSSRGSPVKGGASGGPRRRRRAAVCGASRFRPLDRGLRSAASAGGRCRLLRRHEAAWVQATRHPFLRAVGDGSLPAAAFDLWLAQDYHFVTDLLRFQARLLARAPRPAQAVLATGAAGLVDELAWFERQAAT